MRLAKDAFALHDGILEVFVLERRPGQYAVVEEATRSTALLSVTFHEVRKHVQMVPAVILGGAGQFTGEPDSLKLVGILYQKCGVIFTHLDEKKLLVLSTSPECLYNVMEKVNDALPRLLEHVHGEGALSIKSLAEAESIAHSFLISRIHGSVLVDEISYRGTDHRWIIHGWYRPSRRIYSKRFQVEMDAHNGSVMRFATTSSVRRHGVYFFAELACLLAVLLAVLAWLLQYNLHR
jgi:hypothetical protein